MRAGRPWSGDAKKHLLKAKVKSGSIVYLLCEFITNPHPKFMFIAHIDYEDNFALIFLINSEIHALIEKSPALKACQVTLKQSVYTFLDHDSYLNCAKVFQDLSSHELVNRLVQNEGSYIGHLNADEILQVIEAVNSAPTLSAEEKDLIINSLGE